MGVSVGRVRLGIDRSTRPVASGVDAIAERTGCRARGIEARHLLLGHQTIVDQLLEMSDQRLLYGPVGEL